MANWKAPATAGGTMSPEAFDPNPYPMNPIFKKMNYKGQSPICVLNAPEAFQAEMQEICTVHNALEPDTQYPYLLAFNEDIATLRKHADAIEGNLIEDAIYYLAYPKKSSKKYKSDITRDQGWEALGEKGYEPVRQVAIDADWSALRFRKVANIGQLNRRKEMLLSEEGKKRKEG